MHVCVHCFVFCGNIPYYIHSLRHIHTGAAHSKHGGLTEAVHLTLIAEGTLSYSFHFLTQDYS